MNQGQTPNDIVFFRRQYQRYLEDPSQVGAEWREFFGGLADDLGPAAPPAAGRMGKEAAVQSLIERFRESGHRLARVNPLQPDPAPDPLLAIAAFGLDEADLVQPFHPRDFPRREAPLREILEILRETYCGSVGVEFMHIQQPEERRWLQERMEENRNRPLFSPQQKSGILQKLLEAVLFERFLHQRFRGQQRFSLEGGEVLIPFLDTLVQAGGEEGLGEMVFGMAHRGRLNVLATIFGKPLEQILSEFRDNLELGVIGDGDLKYHKGFSVDVATACGRSVHLTMASNPSHLEAVDPVVEGKTRAKQEFAGGDARARILAVLLHGDAAFPGQGIAAETLNLSQLEGYGTGGTIHVVLNNQIGFTTGPKDARSTPYATDVAKMLMVPIFHVSGEDPEAAVHVARLAIDYRQRFRRDVVVEILCFRRHGHAEWDETSFTQPLLAQKIEQLPPLDELYARRLAADGVSEKQGRQMASGITDRLETAFAVEQVRLQTDFHGKWKYVERDYRPLEIRTGVPGERLIDFAEQLAELPPGFSLHPLVSRLLEERRRAVLEGNGIDWANAEALAFASLVHEGVAVRLSGQDSRRGTFNQRHAVLFDSRDGSPYIPHQAVCARGGKFQVYDSMLSEAAVLGFEFGYSLATPYGLTIWEAQFGDFCNGAQVIIDQFLAGSQTKWNQLSNLVLFLPHGYEGQGAEHSSARIERFLQLAADDNIQVTYPSTPAQFFHLLRRQIKQPFRRPLVVFTPKGLLRDPACRSSRRDLEEGGFRELLTEEPGAGATRTALFCSGKIYFELAAERERLGRGDVAIVRIEQLYPLRSDLLEFELRRLAGTERIAWIQEEPRNMGAWSHLGPKLEQISKRNILYVGRPESAAPAVGSHRIHRQEQQQLIEAAFS
ncbi:MAG: 2-oxoglutarate dehydrogenase E1 component [Deltaproteobacteria bacterium]|nr:2-oxoglutarate dehydrogenase E1 component [Deltaproteobacteria bacterium]